MEWEFSPPDPNAKMRKNRKADRVQPACAGTDKNGNLVWKAKPMPLWQRMMFPLNYKGDFGAHWAKVKDLWAQQGMEYEGDSMRLLSRVYGVLADKYAEMKRLRDQKGD